MTAPRDSGPSPAFTARVVYGALFAGTLVATIVLVIARSHMDGDMPTLGRGALALLRTLVLAIAAGGTVGLRVLRNALPAAPRAGAEDAWWEANLGRAVALWAFPDGVGIAGAVAFFLAGDLLVLALAAGWALAMFVTYAPARLTGA